MDDNVSLMGGLVDDLQTLLNSANDDIERLQAETTEQDNCIKELLQTQCKHRAFIAAFDVCLEGRYTRLCGVISRGGNSSDESEFESCSYLIAIWRQLKSQHLEKEMAE